jgi:DNA-binding XRE family transcriptional regulator
MAIREKPAKTTVLGRTLDEVIATMSPESQARVAAKAEQMRAEIEGLKALRLLADRSQEQIAQALAISQPAVLKIERQTDLYLSTLRRFVEAAGGTLELRVELPGKGVLRLTGMGDLNR